MTITKEKIIAQTEIVGKYKIIQVAYDTIITEDEHEISRSRSRKSFAPNVDVSSEDAEVQAIANVVWTQAVKDAWTIKLAEQDGLK